MPFKAVVVSTGGGAVVRPQNWGYMQHGVRRLAARRVRAARAARAAQWHLQPPHARKRRGLRARARWGVPELHVFTKH